MDMKCGLFLYRSLLPWRSGRRDAQRRPPRDPANGGAVGTIQGFGGEDSRAASFARCAVISSRLAMPRK